MLKQNIEIEYKCLVTKEEYFHLLSLYQKHYQRIWQKNIYYLDDNKQLEKLKAVLRLRKTVNENLLTLKIPQDKLIEMEKSNADLNDLEFLAILASYNIYPPFKENGYSITYRRLIDLKKAQLCLDESHFLNSIDYEIEYELKYEHDGLEDFRKILATAKINYFPNTISKYQRALNSQL